MTNTKRLILTAGLLVLFILAAVLIYHTLSRQVPPETNSPAQTTAARETAPDFTVVTGDGKTIRLSDMRGKPVILNFWASWCSYCKEEMPLFDQLYQENRKQVTFMMVDLTDGQSETVSQGKAYLQSKGFTFPAYFDTKQEAAGAYNLTAIPQTYLIDRNGYIVKHINGAAQEQELRQGLALIKGTE